MRNEFIAFSIISVVLIGGVAWWLWHPLAYTYIVLLPVIGIGFYDMFQTRQAIKRNFPILGRGRYIFESLRPKLYQYFIESDTDGTPFSRTHRSIVYQRAKKELDTTPFGTQLNVYDEGYEWMAHSIAALDKKLLNHDPRVLVGGPACKQPYSLSIFNVSAMSFGSLSKAAIMALNGGAKIGGFAHNTGEGGISPYHIEMGGDLIYQVGTGYFGCRADDGNFSPERFKVSAAYPNVKMIELKLSQGAKPGHGGILPAAKNTPEIAAIRGVKPHTQVDSPPYHRAFTNPLGLLKLIQQMRELSDGKPVGFKLCIGHKHEFVAICKAMIETGITPDFITVDGGEGGTGAAPLEFSNYVGMPFKEALAFVYDTLMGFDLKKHITILAAGKVISGFDMVRAMALGADACYSARAMMMALGCIQALECNNNKCPTGVATQDPELVKGLVVENKQVRVANYHQLTVESFVELMAAAGLKEPSQITRRHLSRRVFMNLVKRYDEIYPYVPKGSLLDIDTCPQDYAELMRYTNTDSFAMQ
ncbi:FMN-binding glutamate synthase family protein [Xanthocytophaga agilis]|uniref:FMN-binding glutamate synthase family protein n=1 Tax=Xanthocytophaga agilis TaxID=3048010 RepID=A0AAE3QWZ2_9BACT|nr:FMN-binding glutamate synthase family protein [Xanthocytophaga agilis]MDJ1499085.1 FMN-binding glutamate synthase family protein [Xanthocytophaga agilis]